MAINKALKQLQQEYNENLAKELGYDDFKAMKSALSEKGSVKQRLESGQGFKEAISGSTKEKLTELKKTFSKEGAKDFGKDVYRNLFKGDDIFSAYMRGRLVKKPKQLESKEKEGVKEEGVKPTGAGLDSKSNTFLKIIAKETMSIPGMARDTNVLRQNLQKLVKLWGGKKATGADAHWLKTSQRTEKLEVESEKERAKDLEFFKEEDRKESEMEKKDSGPSVVVQQVQGKEDTKKEGGMFGGLLDTVMGFFKNGLLGGLTKLFNPMAILKLLGKVFVIGTIIISLFKGITAGFERWKETGSLKEAIIAGLGAIVDFITFGFFGEDSVRTLLDKVSEFMDPVLKTVSDVVDSIKNWIGDNIGIPKITIPIPDILQKLPGVPKEISIGPYYPFKSKTSASTGNKTQAETPPPPKTPAEKGTTAAAASETTTPTPATATATSTTETAPTSAKIKLPDGWQVDPTTGYYIFPRAYEYLGSIRLNPDTTTQEDIDKINKEFLDKEKEKLSAVASSGSFGKTSGGAAGGVTGGATVGSSGGAGAGGASGSVSASPSSGGGGVTASPTGATLEPTQKSSGASLSEASSAVAEQQRMESAADMGSVIDTSTKNSQNKVSGNSMKKMPDVYNETFVNLYATT